MSLVIDRVALHTASSVTERVAPSADAAAAAYAAFFRSEFAAVTRTAYLVLHDRDAAEDAAQDAFA